MLNKPALKNSLTALYNQTLDNGNLSPEEAKDAFIERLANAIEAFVKTATVNYTGGLTSTNGPVTGVFNHNIV